MAAPQPASAATSRLRAFDSVMAATLSGEPAPVVLDALGSEATAVASDVVVVVAGRTGSARVYGRDLDLPRRVVLALDRVATGGAPAPTAADGALWADGGAPPWDDVGVDLAAAGLGLPLLVPLVEGAVPLGVLAAFPRPASGASAPRWRRSPARDALADLQLGPWSRLAALILAREADRSRLRLSAVEDGVTGLPTRSLLSVRLREALHRVPRRSLALVQVALDRIEVLEDAVGGDHGDDLLRAAAQRARAAVRPGDVVGHLRANALAIICEGVGPDEAGEIGERVRRALTTPVVVGDHELAVTPGVGVVIATELDTPNSLVHKADIAAREAAGRGGAEVVRYRPGTYEAALARVDVEHDLRRALSEGGLHLVYQPQVSLVDGTVVGVEALVRWEHPSRGPLGPDEFIPVAEETGLVVALGSWAVDTALADMAAGLDTVVSVNLSARQLDDPSLLAHVTDSLARHAVPPERLRLEMTESALARDADRSAALLRTLHELGVRVSIDDFGTGYASLEQLRQVAVADSLKIDRTFVAGIVDDPRDRAIVTAAVTLGRELGFKVVAEGVEDAAQAQILADVGCDAAQGYWYGEPVPVDRLDLSPKPGHRPGA